MQGAGVCTAGPRRSLPARPPAQRPVPYPGVADLGAEAIDGPRAVYLPQLALHVRKPQAHLPGVLVRQHLGNGGVMAGRA